MTFLLGFAVGVFVSIAVPLALILLTARRDERRRAGYLNLRRPS